MANISKKKKQQAGIRCGLNSPFYFRICKENYERFKRYESELRGMNKENEFDVYQADPRKDKQDKCRTIVIVFSAMCMEAFIYDYAAYHLGDRFVREHLDRLKLESKWAVTAKLATGKKFAESSKAYGLLKELRKVRNKLIHSKSKLLSLNFRDINECSQHVERYRNLLREAEKEDEVMREAAHNAYDAIREALLEIDRLDKTQFKQFALWDYFKKNALGQ